MLQQSSSPAPASMSAVAVGAVQRQELSWAEIIGKPGDEPLAQSYNETRTGFFVPLEREYSDSE